MSNAEDEPRPRRTAKGPGSSRAGSLLTDRTSESTNSAQAREGSRGEWPQAETRSKVFRVTGGSGGAAAGGTGRRGAQARCHGRKEWQSACTGVGRAGREGHQR